MTTSFAHFTRGQFLLAMRANLAGVLLAIVSALTIPWSIYSAWRNRMMWVNDPTLTLLWVLLVIMGIGILEWAIRYWGFPAGIT